jgi:iron complex outermembrane recepter protein
MTISKKSVLRIFVASFVVSFPALTQAAPDAATGDSASAVKPGELELEEVVVTAQHRDETVQKAALPVAVVQADQLARSGIVGLDTLDKLVPALQVVTGGQGNLIFIRGVGNFSFTANADPAAAFNDDGIYIGRSSSTVGSFFDLDRIEVLKGPQGTLYGRNATAGAINVLPAQPRLGEWSGFGTVSYGNYDAQIVEGALNVPLGSDAAFRLSGNFVKHDGYLNDGTSADDSHAFRTQFKAQLTPDLTLRLVAHYAHQGGIAAGSSYAGRVVFNPALGKFVFTPSGLSIEDGLFTPAAAAFRGTGAAGTLPGRFLDPLAMLPNQRNDIGGVNAHIDWTTPIGTFTVIPSWERGVKNNFNVNSGVDVGDRQDTRQYSIEARLVSSGDRLIDYMLGTYYFNEKIDDNTHNSTGALANFIPAQYETRSPSAYVNLTLHATDRLRFTGGMRYTSDHKEFSSSTTTLGVVCAIVANCPTAPLLPYTLTLAEQPVFPAAVGAPPVASAPGVLVARSDVATSGSFSKSKPTYRGAVEFDVGPSSLAYTSIESGYRAGGFNLDGTIYNPETITAYTLGLKNQFFSHRVLLNLELFDWKYRDQQLSNADVDATGRLGVITRNIGRSTIRGAEVEGRVLVTSQTTLSTDVQYLDSKYDSFAYTTPARLYSGCQVTLGARNAVDCSGKPALNSPEWSITLGAQQVVPLGALQLTLNANTQYKAGYFTNFGYTPQDHQDALWRSDAEMTIGRPDAKWEITGFVHNIENNRAQVFSTVSPGSNLIVTNNSPPRTYGARVSARF